MRTSFAPKTCVPIIFACSRSAGMKIQHLNPLRAACAAVALARFPVDEQETVSNPNARAFARAVATTRSLKLSVGVQTASFLMKRFFEPMLRPSCADLIKGVKPTRSEEHTSELQSLRHLV